MIGFLKGLVLLPVALLIVLFAVANRGPVVVSLDPFARGAPEFAAALPLWAVLFAAVAFGVVLGGIGSWLGTGPVRQSRRARGREVKRLKAEADRLRSNLAASRPVAPGPATASGGNLPALADRSF